MERVRKHTRRYTTTLGREATAIVDRLSKVRTAAGEDRRRPQAGNREGSASKGGEGVDGQPSGPPTKRKEVADAWQRQHLRA